MPSSDLTPRLLLDPAGVYEVVSAARLHEHPVALPYVYEADGQGTRGQQRSPTDIPAGHQPAAYARRSRSGVRKLPRGAARRLRRRYLPSGVRRSIQSSASARVRSASGLPMRFSRRSTPFSPRHSVARVLRRSTWLLRALWVPLPLLEEFPASWALPLSSSTAPDSWAAAS